MSVPWNWVRHHGSTPPRKQCTPGASWGSGGFIAPRGQFRAGFSEQFIILTRKDEPTSRQESSGKVRWTICNLIPFAKRRLSGHESGSSVLPTAERHEEP